MFDLICSLITRLRAEQVNETLLTDSGEAETTCTNTHTEAAVEIKPECCGKMWCSRVSAARLKERLCGSEYYNTHEPQQPLLTVHTGKTSVV